MFHGSFSEGKFHLAVGFPEFAPFCCPLFFFPLWGARTRLGPLTEGSRSTLFAQRPLPLPSLSCLASFFLLTFARLKLRA